VSHVMRSIMYDTYLLTLLTYCGAPANETLEMKPYWMSGTSLLSSIVNLVE